MPSSRRWTRRESSYTERTHAASQGLANAALHAARSSPPGPNGQWRRAGGAEEASEVGRKQSKKRDTEEPARAQTYRA